MKKLISLSIIVLFFGLVGCGGSRYAIYTNHSITACDINDPLNNIEWLKIYTSGNTKSYNIILNLYKDTLTNNDLFEINYQSRDMKFGVINVYDCSDSLLFHWDMGTSPSPVFNAFYANKKYISKLWSVNEIIQ